jgi:hypothetical protein
MERENGLSRLRMSLSREMNYEKKSKENVYREGPTIPIVIIFGVVGVLLTVIY